MDQKYTVVRGDTFIGIARKFNVTLDELKAANPAIRDINRISVGQVINIPAHDDRQREDNMKTYAIVVNEMGQDVRGSGGVTVSRNNAGIYNVTFPDDIRDWLWQATLGAPDDVAQAAGSAVTQGGMGGARKIVQVRTFDAAGNAADRNFHLRVSDL